MPPPARAGDRRWYGADRGAGQGDPEELEAVAAAIARCVTRNARAARGEEDRDTRWAASGRPSRGPLPPAGATAGD
ncbi:hypothetical protein ACFQ0B_52510 [Nonomuraea thailandensis]